MKAKTLNKTELYELVLRYQKEGNIKARNEIITCNMGLVYKLAHKYQFGTFELDDLVSEGVFGLITAIDKFDTSKGLAFSTYAYHWIRHCVQRYTEKPYHKKDSLILSIDEPIFTKEDEKSSLHDIVPDKSIDPTEKKDLLDWCLVNSQLFKKRDQKVFLLYYGFDGVNLTNKEIADIFGLTQQRVQQIIKDCLTVLTKEFTKIGTIIK